MGRNLKALDRAVREERAESLGKANASTAAGSFEALDNALRETRTATVEKKSPVPSTSEVVLQKLGNWGKRLAFIVALQSSMGKLSKMKVLAIYAASTYVSVWKVIFDNSEPYGTRKYIANLAGDDHAVGCIRKQGEKGIEWSDTRHVLANSQAWITKAIRAGLWSAKRNQGALIVTWAFQYLGRLVAFLRQGKKKNQRLAKALFPTGIAAELISCSRTACLLFNFAFSFWAIVGLASKFKFPGNSGLTKGKTVMFVTLASVIALPVEKVSRWKALAAFMFSSIFE